MGYVEFDNVLFDTETAMLDNEIARGLMYRQHLGANQGMLFVYPQETQISFWMKNTHMPLDLLWLDSNGMILYTHSNANPLSTNEMKYNGLARFVLEVPAGSVSRYSLRPGKYASIAL
jgi:uncharacterized membrane protein (UPF0127 family)